MVPEHLLADLFKVDLEIRYRVAQHARQQHPGEVLLVEAIDLVLEGVELLRTAVIVRLLSALLPETVVFHGRELEAQAQERALVTVDYFPLVERPTDTP